MTILDGKKISNDIKDEIAEEVRKMKENGEVICIGVEDREHLNETSESSEPGIEYFLQLFGVPQERKVGVYTADLKESTLFTKDDEGNYFSLNAFGKVEAKIAVSFNIQNH